MSGGARRALRAALEPLERLAAAAAAGEHLLESFAVRVCGRPPGVQLAQALIASVEPRQYARQVIHTGMAERLQRGAARDGLRVGAGEGSGALALGVELAANQLNLIHGGYDNQPERGPYV